MNSKKDVSIEYAHIYTNMHIGDEQRFSLDILNGVTQENKDKDISLVVMVDDYSFPDPSFDYGSFTAWLEDKGFRPEVVLRESQLIPLCDEVLGLITDKKLKEEISNYIRAKRYPCSLFVAAWYLLRLGCIESSVFNTNSRADKLINILPQSFKPFEDKAFEIIRSSEFSAMVSNIENRYFEGRSVS